MQLCLCATIQRTTFDAAIILGARNQQTQALPEKVEVFVDGKKVLVDPGTTVLQVQLWLN